MLYLITYNIIPGPNNVQFFTAIQTSSTAWWHYIDSAWIIRSDLTANQISTNLAPHVNISFNNLLIVKIDTDITNRQGWLPREAWDWITQHIN